MDAAGQLFRFTARPVIFATGFECSYPKVDHGKRRDELAETFHYEHWKEDFDLCRQVGARHVRYGIPYYKMHIGPHRFDWEWTDMVLPAMRDAGLIAILDLCHFGLPDWAGDFQNPAWPELFAHFAEAFCQRYPWITYYTPVNEILVCARYSAQLGLWNEQLHSDRAMVNAVRNMCRATLQASDRILHRIPNAVFFQSEAAELILERWPETRADVAFYNDVRFLSFDLLYGHAPSGDVLAWLLDNGFSLEDYRWFREHGDRADPHCVLGMDYYANNERYICPDGEQAPCGPALGWHAIGTAYFRRYHKPMMLTETNCLDPEQASKWLWTTWQSVQSLRDEGVPVLGYTWYSLTDQIDWDIQLREIKGHVNGNGLYTLERRARPVAQAFRAVAQRYGSETVLPES